MFKNISAKYRFYLLLAGILIGMLIAYRISVRSTIDTIKSYQELKKRSLEAGDLPSQCASLRKQIAELNHGYFENGSGYDEIHKNFLGKLGKLADIYHATLVEYPGQHNYKSSSVQVETHSAMLKGNFTDLLKILYELEVNERIGKLVSVEYFAETSRKTKIRSLFMHLYIQNYRNDKPDEKDKKN